MCIHAPHGLHKPVWLLSLVINTPLQLLDTVVKERTEYIITLSTPKSTVLYKLAIA